MKHLPPFDPDLDLILEKTVPVPAEFLYRGWTDPELLMRWFVPAPYAVADCVVDPVPGGAFTLTIRDPEGNESSEPGCYLKLIPNELVLFTDTLGPGFRPTGNAFFTGMISFQPAEGGTRYTARAIHGSPEHRKRHADMGFEKGWSLTLDQLVALYKTEQ